MKDIDYRKYKNYNLNEDIYSYYKVKNFSNSFSSSNINTVNNCDNVSSKNSSNTIKINKEINDNKEKSNINISYKNNENIEHNIIQTNDNIEHYILNNDKIDSTINNDKIEYNCNNNANINNITTQNSKSNNKNGKKEKSYYKFINDLDIKRILEESYPNDDCTKDYLINNNNQNINNDINICKNDNINNCKYENISNYEDNKCSAINDNNIDSKNINSTNNAKKDNHTIIDKRNISNGRQSNILEGINSNYYNNANYTNCSNKNNNKYGYYAFDNSSENSYNNNKKFTINNCNNNGNKTVEVNSKNSHKKHSKKASKNTVKNGANTKGKIYGTSNDFAVDNFNVECTYNSKPQKTGKGVFAGFIVVIIFVITFFLCNYFLPNSWDNQDNLQAFAVAKLAVSKDDATAIQTVLKTKGAGGYIYKLEDKIYVIADIYPSLKEAESVKNNSTNSNFFDNVIDITAREYNISAIPSSMYSVVEYALKYIDLGYTKLQIIAQALAKKDIDDIEAKERIKRLNSELLQTKNIFLSNVKNSTDKNILNLKTAIEVCYTKNIDLISSNNLDSEIREVYIGNYLNYLDIINDSYIK